MAEQQNKGILIDVGFNADVNSLISNINSELKKANFGKHINIEEETIKQLNNVAKKIKEINDMKMGIGGVEKATSDAVRYSSELKTITSSIKKIEGVKIKGYSDTGFKNIKLAEEKYTTLKETIDDLGETERLFGKSLSEGFSDMPEEKIKNFADTIRLLQDTIKTGKLDLSSLGIDKKSLSDISSKYKTFLNNVKQKIDAGGISSGNTLSIPVAIDITTSSDTIKSQVTTILDASRQYLNNNYLSVKLKVDTEYQNKKIREDLTEIQNKINNFDGGDFEKLSNEIQPLIEDVGDRFAEGLALKINKTRFEDDIKFVRSQLDLVKSDISNINELTIQPKINLGSKSFEEFEDNLKNLNAKISKDAMAANDEIEKIQAGIVFNNLSKATDSLAEKLIELSNSSESLRPLSNVLKSISYLLAQFSKKGSLSLSTDEFTKFKNAILLPSNSNTIFELLNSISDKGFDVTPITTIATTLIELSEKGKFDVPEKFKAFIDDFKTLGNSIKEIVGVKEIAVPSIQFGEDNLINIETVKTALNSIIDVKNQVSKEITIPTIKNTEEFDSISTTFDNIKSTIDYIYSPTSFDAFLNTIDALKNEENIGAIKSLKEMPYYITGINQEAGVNSVIEVLNEVLSKESAINALANLFNSGFANKLNGTSNITAQALEKTIGSSTLEEFYTRAQQMPELLNKAFTGGKTGILEYTKGVEGLFNAYSTILGDRLNPQKGVISKEEYQEVKEYMSALVTDIQTQMSHVFDNLYATASPSLRRQLDLIRNDLINTMPAGLTQEGDLEKAKQSLDSYQEVVRNINNTLSESQSNVLNTIYEKASKLPDVFNNVISNNSVANIKEYKDLMNDILSLYQLIIEDSRRGNNRIFSKEEAEEVKIFLQGTFKEMRNNIRTTTSEMTKGLGKNAKALIQEELNSIKSTIPSSLSNIGDISNIGSVATNLESAQKKIDSFTTKSERAKQTLEGLRGKITDLGTSLNDAYKNTNKIDTTIVIKKLTTIYNNYVKVRQASEDGLISNKAVEVTEKRIVSLAGKIQKLYQKQFGKDILNEIPENAIQGVLSQFALTGSNDASNLFKDIISTLRELKSERESATAPDENIKLSLTELEELGKTTEDVAMKLHRVQMAGFGGDAENTYRFIELLKAAIEAYDELASKVIESGTLEAMDAAAEKGSTKYDKLSRSISLTAQAFKGLATGYDDYLKSQKKSPINTYAEETNKIKAELSSLFDTGDELGTGGLINKIDIIESKMNEARETSSRLFSDSNTLVNGLAFSKLLGKIYRDMADNSSMSKELKSRFSSLAQEMEARGAAATSKTQFDMYNKAFQELNTEMRRTGQTGKNFFSTLKSNMTTQTAQLIATTFSFYRLISVLKQGVQVATEFNTTLAKISYTMDVTKSELNGMGESILKSSNDLKTSVSSMEQIYTIYANMNTSSKEVEELSQYTAVLSNLSGIDASTAADDIQSVVNQFSKLSSSDTAHIVDVFDYVSRNISVDYAKGIEGMAEGVQAVGNVADQAGLSYEQLSSIIAKTMEQTRNSGSSIANGLKTIMVRLSKASSMDDEVDNSTLSKASAVLHDIGVEVYTAEGEFREFDTIMTELAAKWDSLTEAQQANISFQIAATRQTATLKAILSNWTDSMDLATKATKTNGNALENQEKYAETYAAKIQEMKNAFSGVAIDFFESDSFDGILSFVESLTKALSLLLEKLGLIPTALIAINTPSMLKGLKNIPGMISSISAMQKAFDVNVQSLGYALKDGFDTANITAYGMALDGLSDKQAKLAVNTMALTDVEKEAVLARYESLNATLSLSLGETEEIIKSAGLTDAQLTNVQTALVSAGATDKLTESVIRNALANTTLDDELKEIILLEIQDANAKKAETIAAGGLAKTNNALATSLGLSSKALLGLVAAGAVLGGLVYIFAKINQTQKEHAKLIEDDLSALKQENQEQESINEQLEEKQKRIRELNSLISNGKITAEEQNELNILKEQTGELEKQSELQKEIIKNSASKSARDLAKGPGLSVDFSLFNSSKGLTPFQITSGYRGYEDTDSNPLGYAQFENGLSLQEAFLKNLQTVYSETASNIQKVNANDALTKQLDLMSQELDLYNEIKNANIELTAEQQKQYNSYKDALNKYFKKDYEATGNQTAFVAMDKEYQAEAYRESIKSNLRSIYDISEKDAEIYADRIIKELLKFDGNLEDYLNTEVDIKKIKAKVVVDLDENSIGKTKEKIDEQIPEISIATLPDTIDNKNNIYNFGKNAFKFSFNQNDYDDETISNYVNGLYSRVISEFDTLGKEHNANDVISRMLEWDKTGSNTAITKNGKVVGETFIQGVISGAETYSSYAAKEFNNKLKETFAEENDIFMLGNQLSLGANKDEIDAFADEYVAQLTQSVNRMLVESKHSFEESWAELDDSEIYDGLKDSLSELAEKGQLSLKTFDQTVGADNWIAEIGISAEEAVNSINALYNDLTRLDSFKSSIASLQDAYKEKGEEGGDNIVGADTINGLSGTFGNLQSWDNYRKIAGTSTTTLEELREATNELLTEYYNQGDVMNDLVDEYGNVDEATKQYYISQLDEMGVANAVEVVENKIAYAKAQNAAQTYLNNNATLEEVQDLEKEGLALEGTSQWFVYYSIKKELANNTKIDTSDDIENLKALIGQLDNASESVRQLANIETMLAEAEGLKALGGTAGVQGDYIIEQANKLREQLPDIVKQDIENQLKVSGNSQIEFDVSELLKTGEETSTTNNETKTSEEIDWIARRIDTLNQKIDQCESKLANLFTPKKQTSVLKKELKLLNKELDTYTKGAQKYLSKFNSVVKKNTGVLTGDIVKKIKNGKIKGNLSQLIQTFGSDDATIINDAIGWWDKYQDFINNQDKTQTEIINKQDEIHQKWIDYYQNWSDYRELQGNDYQRGYEGQNKALDKNIKLLKKIAKHEIAIAKTASERRKIRLQLAQDINATYKQEFDNIEKHFSNDTRAINDIISINNAEVSLAEARGQKTNVGYYQNNKKWQRTEYVNLTMEEKELREKLKDLNSGSQEYADALDTLQGVIQSRIQMETDIANENKKIQQAYEDLYSTIASDTKRIATEMEFISSLFAHEKNTDKDVEGFFTEAGLANLDIYRTGLMTSQSNAQLYSEKADTLRKVLENPEKYASIDSTTGATEYIVETPFGEETFNSIEEIQAALDSSYDSSMTYIKELYDYQTKIFNAVKERYETELAYVKELVDERKEALDAEKDLHDYQKTINEKTENITNLQRQISAYTGNSSEEGRARLQALQQQLKEAQEDLEETEYDRYINDQKQMLDDLYDEYEENIQEYLEKFYDRVDEGLNTINDSISNGFIDTVKALYGYTAQYNTDTASDVSSTISSETATNVAQSGVNEKNFETTASIEDIINGLIASNSKFKYTGSKSKSEVSDVNKLIWDKLGKNFLLTGAGLQALAKALGVNYSDGLAKSSGALYKYLKSAGFSTGGIVTAVKKNGDDGLATLKNGEAVLTPLQTRQFSILVDNLSSLNKMVGSYTNLPNFEDIGFTANIENNCGGNTFTFELPNVTDSQSLLNELQSNTKIQKAIQSITIDQLMTQTKLKVKGIK